MGFFFSFISIIIIFVLTSSISCGVFGIVTIIIGLLLSISIRKKYSLQAFDLFSIVYFIYTIVALLHFFDFTIYEQMIEPDEYTFFRHSEWAGQTGSLSGVYKYAMTVDYVREFKFQTLYAGSICYFANEFFDGSNFMLVIQTNYILGALSSILLYRILTMYIQKNKAFYYALVFMLCSPFFNYSIIMVRDIHIAFLFLCGYLIVLKKFSILGLISLGILTFISWGFRTENGLFYFLFIAYYIYQQSSKNLIVKISLTTLFLIVGVVFIASELQAASEQMASYDEASTEASVETGTAAAKLAYSLPSPLKEIVQISNALIHPFPIVNGFKESPNFYEFPLKGLIPLAYSFLWFIVSASLWKWAFQRKFKKLNSSVFLLMLICVLYVALNYHNMSSRRSMAGFPIPFLAYAIMNEKVLSKKNKKETFKQTFSIYTILTILFFLR